MAKREWSSVGCHSSGGAVYGFGFLGALVYFFQHSVTATDYIYGIIKSVAWPGFLVYKTLELLKF